MIDELDLPRSSDFLPFPECDSVFYEDFSEVDTLSSTNNEDKVFNPSILIHENLFEVTNLATPDKNVKNTTNASLILEDSYPPLSLYELPFHKEVPGLGALLSFSSENEKKVSNPGILTSKRVHTSLLKLSHRGSKETDIREKDEKSSKNGQNRALIGKAWKSQSQIEAKVNKIQSQVNPDKVNAENEEIP
ncbi:hypothetical protein Tco_0992527 [Tanacetum coccineum]|uniref:Uncharacterized protein n=1 Tax=Tanacetum coccineum TaxID=301880 RepID=A0ABQ5F321_9ASTR